MHLNGKVIIISSLFLDETGSALGIDFNLRNTREANKLDEAVNVVMEALGEWLCPRQPNQSNFGTGKASPKRPQGWYCLQEVTKLKRTEDSDAPEIQF